MKKSIKIDENYFLVNQPVSIEKVVKVTMPTNHIFIVDVSGSMYNELPLIRKQLKNKLSTIMLEGDTISILWFSGRNDAGILKEEVEVKSLKTLNDLNTAIDRWLVPVGLTAFLRPLELTKGLVNRIKANRPDSNFSLMFLTDGYNNDCPFNSVLAALKDLEGDITSSTFVEYGYYADSAKLTQMASALGGEKISCDGFDDFEPLFDSKMSQSVMSGKKIEVNVENSLYDFAFSCSDGQVLLYNIVDGAVRVNENLKDIYYFSNKNLGSDGSTNMYGEPIKLTENLETAIYASIYVLSDKMQNEDAEKLFYLIGDNTHYKMLMNSFGKQKLYQFKAAIKECVVDQSKRFVEGAGKIAKIADDAYCLMDLIADLGKNDVKFYPSHDDFNYNRIGRKMVAVGSKLTDKDQKLLTAAKTVAELVEVSKEFADKKLDLEFKTTDTKKGYSLKDLVWNSERANLSVLVRFDGMVVLPENKFNIEDIATFKYNTFTLIKDGILNVTKLPVGYSKELANFLQEKGVNYGLVSDIVSTVVNNEAFNVPSTMYIVIDLASLPIINRKMVKSISANKLAQMEWELQKLQAEAKVYGDYKKNMFPKTSTTFAQMLGDDCAAWLKEIGITDFNGFSPKRTAAESTDFYMSVNLITKIKGMSGLPKVSDVLKKLVDGTPMKPVEMLMSGAIKKILLVLESKENIASNNKVLEDFINEEVKLAVTAKRNIMQQIAEIKFALILSKKWFNEFKSFDENKLSVTFDNQSLDFIFDLVEKEEKI